MSYRFIKRATKAQMQAMNDLLDIANAEWINEKNQEYAIRRDSGGYYMVNRSDFTGGEWIDDLPFIVCSHCGHIDQLDGRFWDCNDTDTITCYECGGDITKEQQ